MPPERSREEQITRILQEAAAEGAQVKEALRRHGVASKTYCHWKAKFGGLQVKRDAPAAPFGKRDSAVEEAGGAAGAG